MRQGFGIRLGAALIDTVIVLLLILVIGFATGGSIFAIFEMSGGGAGAERAAEAVEIGFIVLMIVVVLCYWLTEIFFAATPGKMMLGLRIGDENGRPATLKQLTVRWFTKNAGGLIGLAGELVAVRAIERVGNLAGLVIFVGCFFVLGQARQALHDKVAGTAVFKKAFLMQGVGPQGFAVITPGQPVPSPTVES